MNMTVKETAEWLLSRDSFLITNHLRPDGDAHGSAAALCQGLRECGKTAYILPNPDSTERYIPWVENYYPDPEEDFAPAFILSVDTASVGMLNTAAASFTDRIDLAIDHHPSNTFYAKNTCLDGSRASCGEIVYELLLAMPCGVSKVSAAPLYIALSTDTGCFAFANTTSNTLRVAAELVDAGAPQMELNRTLFRTKAKRRMLLEGDIFSHIEFYFGDRVAIITITRAMMDHYGVTENDMDDIAAIPGSVEDVLVGITIRELSGGGCKVSVRSGPDFDSNALCSRFGGGGHKMAAGLSMDADAASMKAMLLEALGETFAQ